ASFTDADNVTHDCPANGGAIPCLGATVNILAPPAGTPVPVTSPTATPTTAVATPIVFSSTPSVTPVGAFYVAIDCDVTRTGVQDTCSYPVGGASSVDVAIVVVNNSGPSTSVAALNFFA